MCVFLCETHIHITINVVTYPHVARCVCLCGGLLTSSKEVSMKSCSSSQLLELFVELRLKGIPGSSPDGYRSLDDPLLPCGDSGRSGPWKKTMSDASAVTFT